MQLAAGIFQFFDRSRAGNLRLAQIERQAKISHALRQIADHKQARLADRQQTWLVTDPHQILNHHWSSFQRGHPGGLGQAFSFGSGQMEECGQRTQPAPHDHKSLAAGKIFLASKIIWRAK
jgi:hypothetical protein